MSKIKIAIGDERNEHWRWENMMRGIKPRLLWQEVNYCIIEIQSGDSHCMCVTGCQKLMNMGV